MFGKNSEISSFFVFPVPGRLIGPNIVGKNSEIYRFLCVP